jgi:Flp pilus assembly protein TadG
MLVMKFRKNIMQNFKIIASKIVTLLQRGGGVIPLCERRHRPQDCQNDSKNVDKDSTQNQTNSSAHSNKSVRKLLTSKGAILIEFAVAIPILIVLLYYVHDLPKLARIQERMEFCAHCMANMLQNANKRVTLNDIRYAVRGAYLTFYPGTTMYSTGYRQHPVGHFPLGFVYYVTGNSNGTASIVWALQFHMDSNFSEKVATKPETSTHAYSVVNFLTNITPSAIHPKLRINPNEKKIIVECCCCYHDKPGEPDTFSDGRKCQNVSPKEVFGLYILSPKVKNQAYFNYIVIFTPKPGLFDQNPPS